MKTAGQQTSQSIPKLYRLVMTKKTSFKYQIHKSFQERTCLKKHTKTHSQHTYTGTCSHKLRNSLWCVSRCEVFLSGFAGPQERPNLSTSHKPSARKASKKLSPPKIDARKSTGLHIPTNVDILTCSTCQGFLGRYPNPDVSQNVVWLNLLGGPFLEDPIVWNNKTSLGGTARSRSLTETCWDGMIHNDSASQNPQVDYFASKQRAPISPKKKLYLQKCRKPELYASNNKIPQNTHQVEPPTNHGLTVVQMPWTTQYCWWFRNPIPNHRLDGADTL